MASRPPQRPFRALSGPTPDGRRAMSEDAVGARSGAPSRSVRALSLKVRCPSGGGPKRALKRLCGAPTRIELRRLKQHA
eukprot:10211155-Alexandrium_andersonii.AAC.1